MCRRNTHKGQDISLQRLDAVGKLQAVPVIGLLLIALVHLFGVTVDALGGVEQLAAGLHG